MCGREGTREGTKVSVRRGRRRHGEEDDSIRKGMRGGVVSKRYKIGVEKKLRWRR